MTEKQFTIDNESDIIEFDWNTNEYIQEFRWGDGKSWDRICNRLNELYDEKEQLKKEKQIIKEKLLNYILDYNKISNDNWSMGLSESVETLHDEVEELFENPFEWKYDFYCSDCKQFNTIDSNFDEGKCIKFDKVIDYQSSACNDFEWD